MRLTCLMLLWVFTATAGIFEIRNYDNLQINFQGVPLVAGERFSLRGENGFGGDKTLKEELGGRTVVNHWGELAGVPYRREAALNAAGSEVEVNFQMDFKAYLDHLTGKPVSYEFTLPFEAVEGMRYTALTGRASSPQEKSGVIDARAPVNFIGATVRQLALEGNGKKLVIDFCPHVPSDRTDYGPNGIQGLWKVSRQKDKILCNLVFVPKYFGGTHSAKVIFYSGSAADYDLRHAARKNPYYTVIAPDRQYAFGAEKSGKQYMSAGTKPFSAAAACGWLENRDLKVENYRPSGAFYSAVYSDKPAVFKMTGLRPGLHILTLISATGDQSSGPFDIAVNGQAAGESLTVPPRTVNVLNFPIWLEEGTAEIRFSGQWRISTLGDQLLMASAEDFIFRRGFWISERAPVPSIMFNHREYTGKPRLRTAIDAYPLPEPGQEMASARREMEYFSCHAQFNGGDWRFQARTVGLGPSNTGHLNEFADPAALLRRLTEIKNDWSNVIVTNGLLVRHAYPAHLERVEQVLAATVKTAHEQGLKVMDHQDYSILRGENMGYRILAANTPFLQQTVDDNLPTRGFCPVNPAKLEQYFKYMVRHIEVTGIDSIKIDEMTFHGIEFCGCPSCRKTFTAETNWQLPADELSEHLWNQDSPLWRTWLNWRRKKIGDFWVELMRRIKTVRQDFVIAGYSTHNGLTTPHASREYGADLEQSARGWSMIGTEIMSRNIFESYRSIQSFRQAFNIYRNSNGLPVYGLIYANNWNHLYFGWALNNMYAQVTQASGMQCPEGMTNFRIFTQDRGNMNFEQTEAVTRIALLFSHPSRHFPQRSSYFQDIAGMSQLLNLRHIQHEFIHEGSLTAEGLRKYRVLLANNAMCLSAGQIAAIRGFAEAGGKVLLTSHAAQADDFGTPFEQWPFQDIFPGMKASSKMSSVKSGKFFDPAASDVFCATEEPLSGLRWFFSRKPGRLEVLLEAEDSNGKRIPALVGSAYGKGVFYFSPFQVGAPACAREFGVRQGSKMTFRRLPGAEAVGQLVLDKIIGGVRVWDPGNTPEKVLVSIYRENHETVIHFLNATGTRLQFDEVVPFGNPVNPFPPLPEDIRFSMALDGLSEAYAVSPDFPGRKKLDFHKQPDGSYAITLPKELLSVYTLVRLK